MNKTPQGRAKKVLSLALSFALVQAPIALISAVLGTALSPSGASAQTFEILNKLIVDGSSTFKGAALFASTSTPSAYAGNGTIYYDLTANALEGSNNGGAFAPLTLQGNTFNGANELVQLNGSSQLPAASGALLTNLPWGSLTGSPTGCSAGTFATGASGSTLTCGTPSGVSPVGSALTSGDIWVGNGSNVAAAVGLSGDAALSNAGALTLNTVNSN
ncbi:MAG: hypothetical protein ACYCPQ_03085, partial [Elusimicrobiota bacterium]